MKDTIRLSQRNKDRLCSFDDDGNTAIEKVLDAHDRALVREATKQEFAPLLQSVTSFQTGTPNCTTGASTPTSSAQSTNTNSTYSATSFDPDYWKKMKNTVESALEPYTGR